MGVIVLEDMCCSCVYFGWEDETTLDLRVGCNPMSDHGVRYSTVLSPCMHQADKQYGMPARPAAAAGTPTAIPGTLPATSDHTTDKREGHCQSPVIAAWF